MERSDALGPTAPAHPPPPVARASKRIPNPRVVLAATSAGAALTVLLLGIAIGRCTKTDKAAPTAP